MSTDMNDLTRSVLDRIDKLVDATVQPACFTKAQLDAYHMGALAARNILLQVHYQMTASSNSVLWYGLRGQLNQQEYEACLNRLKIKAIKLFRQRTGHTLRDSKMIVEDNYDF